MTAYMDHKDLANETIDAARIQEITDGAHRVLDLIAQTEFTSGREGWWGIARGRSCLCRCRVR